MFTHNDAASGRKAAIKAISIPDRKNCYPGGRLGHIGTAIPECLSGAHVTQRKDPCLPSENWFHRKSEPTAAYNATGTLKRQVIAVKRQTWTHHRVPTLMVRDDCRSVRRVDQRGIEAILAQHAARVGKPF